jgi:hypothetical protein
MITRVVKCEVFLEGVKVPFNSVRLTVQPNAMNTLTLDIPPVRDLFDIFPRTFVQVFYDNGDGWKNFFEGEVISHGFSKDAQGGRSMTLVCGDLANYWVYSYAYFLENKDITQISLEDRVLFFAGVNPSSIGSRREAEAVMPIRTLGLEARSLLRASKDGDIVTGLRKVFALIENVNSFYTNAFAKYRLNDRMVNMPDSQIQFLLDALSMEGISENFFSHHAHVPVLQMLSVAMSQIYQVFWSLPLPAMRQDIPNGPKKPVSFLITPATFLTAPPRCNVIFPDLHEGFSYSRNFLDEPTRFELYTSSSQGAAYSQFNLAPAPFRDLLKEIRKAQSEGKDLKTMNLIVKNDDIEFDESIRGIIPQREALMQDGFMKVRASTLQGAGDKEKAKEDAKVKMQKFVGEVTEFEFLLRKFASRNFGPVQMPFNPNIHPAFPILLLDKEARIFASPTSLVHMISADGAAATAVGCTLARHKDVVTNFQLPPWINKSYVPEAIGEDSYASADPDGKTRTVRGAYPFLIGPGHRSVLSDALDITEKSGDEQGKVVFRKPKTQEEAADALFDMYLKSGDRQVFVEDYTARPVMTKKEALDLLGVTETNSEQLDGTVYDSRKRAVIETMKVKLVEAGFAVVEI